MKAITNPNHAQPDNAFQMSVSLVLAVVTVLGTVAAVAEAAAQEKKP